METSMPEKKLAAFVEAPGPPSEAATPSRD